MHRTTQKRTSTECEAVTNGGTEQCGTATIRGVEGMLTLPVSLE